MYLIVNQILADIDTQIAMKIAVEIVIEFDFDFAMDIGSAVDQIHSLMLMLELENEFHLRLKQILRSLNICKSYQ